MLSSIRVRLTGGPFDGQVHELYGLAPIPDEVEFVVLDDLGCPSYSVATARYTRNGEPAKGGTPYLYLDPNLSPEPKEMPQLQLIKPIVFAVEYVRPDNCPFEPGSFHPRPLILDGKAQKVVYRVLGYLPGYRKN